MNFISTRVQAFLSSNKSRNPRLIEVSSESDYFTAVEPYALIKSPISAIFPRSRLILSLKLNKIISGRGHLEDLSNQGILYVGEVQGRVARELIVSSKVINRFVVIAILYEEEADLVEL